MNGTSAFAAAILLAGTAFSSPAAEAPETPEVSSASRVLEVPLSAGSGDGKEVSVLLDESQLKLATIALRNGTVLGTHSAPVPATILVLEGTGVIHVGGEPMAVSKGTLVSLAAGEEHDVVPEGKDDMLVLVHYLRGAGAAAAPGCMHHGHGATGHHGHAAGAGHNNGDCPHHGDAACAKHDKGECPHHDAATCAKHDKGECPHHKAGSEPEHDHGQ